MGSDPGTQLSDLARRPSRELDMAEVERRGRRGRVLAVASRSLLAAALIAIVTTSVFSEPFGDRSAQLRPGEGTGSTGDATAPSQRGPQGELFESVSQQTQAEIFAFRALAAIELMDPYGKRSYNWTYDEDTTRTDAGWQVGFAASDCEPRDKSQTCTGLSGEDPELGNAITDTFVTVALDERVWTVVDVEGNMLAEERERVIGYSLPQEQEPSHWDFAAVGMWEGEFGLAMTPIWVGPYPTQAPGSVCEVQWVDASGDPLGKPSSFYQEPPRRPFERGGWVRGGGGEKPKGDAADAAVTCEQYTGEGWEVASQPQVVGTPGEVTGVTAELVWHGDEGFTTGAVCTASLQDADGETVWDGSGSVTPLWRPGDMKRYPYRTDVFVSTRGESVDAERIGDFECESR